MAIVPGNSSLTEQPSASTFIDATKPTGLTDGAVIVAHLTGNGGTLSVPSGWTLIPGANATNSTWMSWGYYHVVTSAAGEPATYTWSAFTSGRITAILEAYTGVDNATPVDVATAATAGTAGTTTVAIPQITTITNGALLISGAGQDSSTGTATAPGSMTQVSTSTGTGKRASYAREAFPTAGATGTRTWTFDSASLGHGGWLSALRPAAGPASTWTYGYDVRIGG